MPSVGGPPAYVTRDGRERLAKRRLARRASATIAFAAFLPGPPVIPPPGWAPAPHR